MITAIKTTPATVTTQIKPTKNINGSKRQTIQWPRVKDRQYNDQEEKTDNTITKRKRQTIQ